MNIEQEIIGLEKQLNALKQKQKEQGSKVNVECGQLFINGTDTSLTLLIFKIDESWGYIYDDGSGDIFDSKQELEKHLSDKSNGFSFYCDDCRFTKN